MTEIFARLAPTATLDSARSEVRTVYGAMTSAHPETYTADSHYRVDVSRMHDQLNEKSQHDSLGALRCRGIALHHRLLQRREPDSRPHRAPRIRTRRPLRARCHAVDLAPRAPRGKPRALHFRCDCRTRDRLAHGFHLVQLRRAFLCARRRPQARFQPRLDRHRSRADRRVLRSVCSAASCRRRLQRQRAHQQWRSRHRRQPSPLAPLRRHPDRGVVPASRRGRRVDENSSRPRADAGALRHQKRSRHQLARHELRPHFAAGLAVLPRRPHPGRRDARR